MDTEIARGRFLSLKVRGRWEFVERTNAREIVAVIAVTPEKELIMVEQYRPPVESRVIELPAGLVGDVEGDDSVEEAEVASFWRTGYRAGSSRPCSKGLFPLGSQLRSSQ